MKDKLIFTNKNKPIYILAIASLLYTIVICLVVGTFLLPDDFFLFQIFKRHILLVIGYGVYFFADYLATFYTLEIDYKDQIITVKRTKLIFSSVVKYSDSLPEYISLNGNLLSFDLKIWLTGNKRLQFGKSYNFEDVLNQAKEMSKLLKVDIYVNVESKNKYWIENKDL